MDAAHSSRPLLISRWARRLPPEPRALQPGFVGIDERSFADILAESVHFSHFLRYFDARNLPDGTWEDLLAADPSAVLALLATLDVDARSAGVEALVRAVRREPELVRKEHLLRRLIGSVLRLAGDIDRWLGPAEQIGGARHLLEHEIREVLAPRLRRLLGIVAAAEEAGLFLEKLTGRVEHFRPVWLVESAGKDDRIFDPDRWIDPLLDDLADHIDAFVAGVGDLAARSAAAMEASLEEKDHAPHVALLMAFIRLFRHAQDEINRLPQRIATFYRDEVLREGPRPALPDRTFLAFTPVPGGAMPEIPAFMLFPAGKDEAGSPIQFAADEKLRVTGANLAGIRLWQPVAAADGTRQRVNAAAAPIPPDGRIGLNPFAAPGLPQAATGLIIASPALELRSGARRVTIRFMDLDPAPAVSADLLRQAFRLSFLSPAGWIESVGFSAEATGSAIAFGFAIAEDGPPLAAGAAADRPADAPALAAVKLALSQDMIGDAAPLALLGGLRFGELRIEVEVDGLADLAVSTPSGIAAAAPGAALFGSPPMPGGWLRIDHPAFAAARMDRIAFGLTWLGLPADADGFAGHYRQYVVRPDRTISTQPLFTDDGFRVDICAPVGDGKLLRNERLFAAVSDLRPAAATAAAAQPAAEPVGADAIVAAPAQAPVTSPPPDTEAGDTKALRGTSWFAIDGGAPDARDEDCPGHAILVTLAAPDYGFGDTLYPPTIAYASALIAAGEGRELRRESLFGRLGKALGKLLAGLGKLAMDALKAFAAPMKLLWQMAAVPVKWLHNLIFVRTYSYEDGEGPEEQPDTPAPAPADRATGELSAAAAFPNPPWRPTLAGIRLNYASHASWSAAGEEGAIQLHHIAPLEGRVQVPLAARPSLLPLLPDRPCFDLGIGDWPAGADLSLLFLMGTPPGGDVPPSGIAIQHRGEDGWLDLPAGAIASDGTKGFSTPGILTLKRPKDDAEILWLRIAAKGAGQGFPPIARIIADALTATRFGTMAGTALPPVPAGTINEAPGARGIARVEQPLDSFGGAPAEDEARVAQRISARLRHKDRSVLGWDVEHLLLERFPEIERVRVLPARAPDAADAPGHLTAIVIPAPDGAPPPDPPRPATAPDLRDAVAAWLGDRSSPFARIHVVDPAFETVDIRVSAFFGADDDGAKRLRADLGALLSPWTTDGLDLPDEAGPRALQSRIFQFVRSRPYVAGIESVEARLNEAIPAGQWRVPVAGNIEIMALARSPGAGC